MAQEKQSEDLVPQQAPQQQQQAQQQAQQQQAQAPGVDMSKHPEAQTEGHHPGLEPTLNLTLSMKEILKLLTFIEQSDEYKFAIMLELEPTAVQMHKAMYNWFVTAQQRLAKQ